MPTRAKLALLFDRFRWESCARHSRSRLVNLRGGHVLVTEKLLERGDADPPHQKGPPPGSTHSSGSLHYVRVLPPRAPRLMMASQSGEYQGKWAAYLADSRGPSPRKRARRSRSLLVPAAAEDSRLLVVCFFPSSVGPHPPGRSEWGRWLKGRSKARERGARSSLVPLCQGINVNGFLPQADRIHLRISTTYYVCLRRQGSSPWASTLTPQANAHPATDAAANPDSYLF